MEEKRTLDLLSEEDVNQIFKNIEGGIYETDEYTISGTRMCSICHLKTGKDSCKTYPNGIPEDVYNGTNWTIDCLSD